MDNAARQPFQHQFALVFTSGSTFDFGTLVVPAGKRLVVEYVEAYALTSAHPVLAYVHTAVGTEDAYYHFTDFKGANGYSTATGQVRLYADPGTTVTVFASRPPSDSTAGVSMSLSGYLVDVP